MTLIAVDPDALRDLHRELAALRREVEALRETVAPDEWRSVTDAAACYGVSESTVRRWIAAGRIEARGAGKTRQVRCER
mgnify:CR=1 FL=1